MTKRMKIALVCLITAVIGFAIYGWRDFANSRNEVGSTAWEEEDEVETDRIALEFNADSAYAFVKAQCDFGPRPMNTPAHDTCRDWIIGKFKQYGCKVMTQKVDLKGYDGTVLHASNIMAQYRPELTTRILLYAHYDSRPWADNDPDPNNWRKPILAANDGASGVGVMIEMARMLQKVASGTHKISSLELGVDFVCFDAEDWGTPQWADVEDKADSWALGAQYFAAHMPEGYEARYGILLDMVGGQGAKFYQEAMSQQFAEPIVKKVWKAARRAGYGSYFPKATGGAITDDHIPMNEVAKIPTIDIIPYYPDCRQSSFGPTWHTLSDDMDHIDKMTLKAVGQTLVEVLFTEQK